MMSTLSLCNVTAHCFEQEWESAKICEGKTKSGSAKRYCLQVQDDVNKLELLMAAKKSTSAA